MSASLTPGRWEITTEPVVIDTTRLAFRATLFSYTQDKGSWTGSTRDSVTQSATVYAQECEAIEAHKTLPVVKTKP